MFNAEKTEAYLKLVKVIQTSTEITVLLKELINPTSNIPPLTDGSTSKPVSVIIDKKILVNYTDTLDMVSTCTYFSLP